MLGLLIRGLVLLRFVWFLFLVRWDCDRCSWRLGFVSWVCGLLVSGCLVLGFLGGDSDGW